MEFENNEKALLTSDTVKGERQGELTSDSVSLRSLSSSSEPSPQAGDLVPLVYFVTAACEISGSPEIAPVRDHGSSLLALPPRRLACVVSVFGPRLPPAWSSPQPQASK